MEPSSADPAEVSNDAIRNPPQPVPRPRLPAAAACFDRDAGLLHPTEASRGFWTPDAINGPFIVGLIGCELERIHGDPDWQPARLTVDLHSLPRMAPLAMTTCTVRSGGRLALADAELTQDGIPMVRATCQFLRRTGPPAGMQRPTPGWDAPPPERFAPIENRMSDWELRPIVGRIGSPWPRRMWVRPARRIVHDVALTPFARAALIADFASALANSGDGLVGYINSDVTLYLHRLPVGEWIGLEAAYHQGAHGVANGTCWLHDEIGPIGSSSVAAITQSRRTAT